MSTYARLLLAHLPAFLTGLALVELLWPKRGPRDAALKLALAPLLGWGISSCLYFGWCLAYGPDLAGFNTLEWLLGLGLALLALLSAWREWRDAFSRGHTSPQGPAQQAAALLPGTAALLVFLILAGMVWLWTSAKPSGNFDAYATWNLRARLLFLNSASGSWTAAFSPQFEWWTHADYPLLWPLVLLRGYLSQGRLLSQAAVLQGFIFGACAGGVFMAGLGRLRGAGQAALGGLLLLGLPSFLSYSAFQQADLPLASFYLVSILLLALAHREKRAGLLILAGLAAGCAAWTKNEGLVFVLATLVTTAIEAARARQPVRLAAFLAGLALPLTTVLLFKLLLAPPGDLIGSQALPELLAKLGDPSRYLTILAALVRQLPSLGGLGWTAVLALTAAFLLAGLAQPRPSGLGARWLFLPLALTLLGYCAIYLITPHPLEWHLGYSLDRLCFQLFVPALFLLLALARNPGELLQALRQ